VLHLYCPGLLNELAACRPRPPSQPRRLLGATKSAPAGDLDPDPGGPRRQPAPGAKPPGGALAGLEL